MKSPMTDGSRMTAIRKISPFLMVCRIGNLNRMVAGFAEKKELVGCRGLI